MSPVRSRPTFVCFGDTTLVITNQQCSNAAKHTPHPAGYIALSEWADDMLATHEQAQCPSCGEWEIWRRKRHAPAQARGSS